MNGIIFEKIEINAFGCIKNKKLEFNKGLNIIEAENGVGKSTLAAFIKFVFYGFAGIKLRTSYGNERDMYIPWGENTAEGTITISTPKGNFSITRSFTVPSKNNVVIVDVMTGKRVLDGIEPGKYFFGITEETFVKTAFFYSLVKNKNGDETLANQLQNLVFSADEQVSYEKAAKKLSDAAKELINNQKHGLIADKQYELERIDSELLIATETNDALFKAMKDLRDAEMITDAKERYLSKIEAERENIDRYDAKKKLIEINTLRENVESASMDYESSKDDFISKEIPTKEYIDTLLSDNESMMNKLERSEANKEEAMKCLSEVNEFKEKNSFLKSNKPLRKIVNGYRGKNFFIGFASTLLIFSALCFAGIMYLFYELGNKVDLVLSWSIIGVIAFSFVLLIISIILKRSYLSKYGFKNKFEFKKAISDFESVLESVEILENKAKTLNAEANDFDSEIEELSNSIYSRISKFVDIQADSGNYNRGINKLVEMSVAANNKYSELKNKIDLYQYQLDHNDIEFLERYSEGAQKPERTREYVDRDIDFTKKSLSILREKEKEIEKNIAVLKVKPHTPSELSGKRDALQNDLKQLWDKRKAYVMAIEFLEKAGTYMRSTISPKLTEYATEYFCEATSYNYPSLKIDTALNMYFDTESSTKSADYLSDGTKDTAYLCLRLALLKLIFKNGNPPLVLDDAFCHLDEKRLEAMMKILSNEVDNGTQVIIFTCRKNERQYLVDNNIVFKDLTL